MLVVFLSGAFLYLLSYRYFWKVDSKEREQGPGYEMLSHRGVTVDAPENTIEAFMDAVNRGFRWIELDVLTTKDRALVCSHNFDLERETDTLTAKDFPDPLVHRSGFCFRCPASSPSPCLPW